LNEMKIRSLSRDEVRQIDQIAIHEYGISGVVLMENAGRDAARWITSNCAPGLVCILCGKGNNGGDGYAIARHIETAQIDTYQSQPVSKATAKTWRVRIISVVSLNELSGDAAINAQIALKSEIPIDVAQDAPSLSRMLAAADVIVDCLLGTGAFGAPRGLFAAAITSANQSHATRIAIDLPSGLDCDSGIANEPTFCAGATLTLVAPKIGFAHPEAQPHLGRIITIPIGVSLKQLAAFLVTD